MLKLCRGLFYLHTNRVIHYDIKVSPAADLQRHGAGPTMQNCAAFDPGMVLNSTLKQRNGATTLLSTTQVGSPACCAAVQSPNILLTQNWQAKIADAVCGPLRHACQALFLHGDLGWQPCSSCSASLSS